MLTFCTIKSYEEYSNNMNFLDLYFTNLLTKNVYQSSTSPYKHLSDPGVHGGHPS